MLATLVGSLVVTSGLRGGWRRRAGSRLGARSGGMFAAFLMVATSMTYGHASTVGSDSGAHQTRKSESAETRGRVQTVAMSSAALAPLYRPGLDLRAPPVDVPLQLRIPSINVIAPILGVGITANDTMDAPMGSANDPVWQQAFWYRGGGAPGDVGTATIAGHLRGGRGPSIFANLNKLRPGDVVVVRDTRSGLDVAFAVTATKTYSLKQIADPSVLAQIYGSGPVGGRGAQPAGDGLSHLTLITCAGNYVGSSFDHRLVVYAERVS